MLLQQVIPALVLKPAVLTGVTPKAGEAVDPVTQVGRALRELGIQMIPAYSPQARGRSERNFSTWQGPPATRVAAGGVHHPGGGQSLSARALHR
jgi:hypothetical protein